MAMWDDCSAVERDPGKVSGSWVFRGTRVPVAALFENLRDGATIEQFLEWFPGVERRQVESVLDQEMRLMNADGRSGSRPSAAHCYRRYLHSKNSVLRKRNYSLATIGFSC